MRLPILLLGPHRAGQSTVGRLLAEQLALPLLQFGSLAPLYFQEIAYDEAASALEPYPNVVLLLPSPDRDESIRRIEQRQQAVVNDEINEHFVRHHSNHDLAKRVVYTKGQTPEETCAAIIERCSNGPSSHSQAVIHEARHT